MKAEDVALTVYGAGFDEGGGDSDAQKLLDKLRAQLDDPRLFEQRPLADGVRNAAALHGKPVRATKAFAGPLQLVGGRSLPVECWRRVSKATSIGFKKASKSGVDSADAPGNPAETVSYEKRHFVASAPDDDVTPESIKAMRFGRDLIPIQKADEEMMGNGVEEKTFALIGFVPQETLPRHFLGTAETVIGGAAARTPCRRSPPSSTCKKVGIARTRAAVANPRLVACGRRPSSTASTSTSHSPRSAGHRVAPRARRARRRPEKRRPRRRARAEFADDGDGADEPLRPEDVRHPQQQYTYQCIKHRAMQHLRGDGTVDIGLPAPDWRILRSFKRDEALQRAAPQLAAFGRCPLAAAAGTKRKAPSRPTRQKRSSARRAATAAAAARRAAAASASAAAGLRPHIDERDEGRLGEADRDVLGDAQGPDRGPRHRRTRADGPRRQGPLRRGVERRRRVGDEGVRVRARAPPRVGAGGGGRLLQPAA